MMNPSRPSPTFLLHVAVTSQQQLQYGKSMISTKPSKHTQVLCVDKAANMVGIVNWWAPNSHGLGVLIMQCTLGLMVK